MNITRRNVLKGAAAAGGTLAMPSYLRAQSADTEISVQYSSPVLFKELKENIAREFMAKNPKIKVTLRAPEQSYEEILQRNLRDVITNNLPDVAFHGLNRQRTLEERNIPVDLKPFMDADPQTKELGFSPSLLSLGQVAGKQTGIGFSLSTPILYYNADLIKAAGGDPGQAAVHLGRRAEARRRRARSGQEPDRHVLRLDHHRQLVVAGARLLAWRIDAGSDRDQGRLHRRAGREVDAPAAPHGRRRENARHQARDHVPGHVRRPHGHLDAVDRAACALQPRDRRPLPPGLRALSAVGSERAAAGRRQRRDDVHQGRRRSRRPPGSSSSSPAVRPARP